MNKKAGVGLILGIVVGVIAILILSVVIGGYFAFKSIVKTDSGGTTINTGVIPGAPKIIMGGNKDIEKWCVEGNRVLPWGNEPTLEVEFFGIVDYRGEKTCHFKITKYDSEEKIPKNKHSVLNSYFFNSDLKNLELWEEKQYFNSGVSGIFYISHCKNTIECECIEGDCEEFIS